MVSVLAFRLLEMIGFSRRSALAAWLVEVLFAEEAGLAFFRFGFVRVSIRSGIDSAATDRVIGLEVLAWVVFDQARMASSMQFIPSPMCARPDQSMVVRQK